MTDRKVKPLAADDEMPVRRLLRVGLGAEGFAILEAPNGRTASESVAANPPDLMLRDWRAGGMGAPVIILPSRTDEAGIVAALVLGADDYVTKPFSTRELMARIQVALRYRLQEQGERPAIRTGTLTVDLVRRIVRARGTEVKLAPKEHEILRVLVQHAGKVLTHRFLLEQVWGQVDDVRYLRVFIPQLWRKLEYKTGTT